jgi:hypothetical protein
VRCVPYATDCQVAKRKISYYLGSAVQPLALPRLRCVDAWQSAVLVLLTGMPGHIEPQNHQGKHTGNVVGGTHIETEAASGTDRIPSSVSIFVIRMLSSPVVRPPTCSQHPPSARERGAGDTETLSISPSRLGDQTSGEAPIVQCNTWSIFRGRSQGPTIRHL